MPKVKMPRSAPSLDMTPLVDLAFLLVTFFILTSSFREPEPVTVDVPSSTNDSLLPKKVFLVTIDADGRTFIDLSDKRLKGEVFMEVAKRMKVAPTNIDSIKFANASSMGLPMKSIADYLSLDPADRNKYRQPGVPYDTTEGGKNTELFYWAEAARISAANDFKKRQLAALSKKQKINKQDRLRFAIKADAKTKYDVVQAVIQVFRTAEIKEFEMITGLEDKPKD